MANPTTTRPTAPAGYARRMPALFVILAGEAMDLLDVMIALIAAPSIVRDLGGGETLIQWFTAAYTTALAAGLLVGGRLGDIVGRKRLLLVGMAGFVAASALCAAATSPGMLIAARVAQGLLGALMLPQGLGLIKQMFPPWEIGKAMGLFGPVMGIASLAGPLLAGGLIAADWFGAGWRLVFLINVPIGIAALLAGIVLLPRSEPHPNMRLDAPGALLACAGMALLVYPLIQGREQGWPLWTFGLLAASIACLALFAALERQRGARGLHTLLEGSLFGKRTFVASCLSGLAFWAGLSGGSLVTMMLLQLGLHWTPLTSALATIPQTVGTVVGFIVANALIKRLGRRLMHLGLAVSIAGMLLFAVTVHWAGAGLTPWALIPSLLLVGVGMTQVMAPFFQFGLGDVDEHESGSASGFLTSIQQVGSSLGAAGVGTVFFGTLGASGTGFNAYLVAVWAGVAAVVTCLLVAAALVFAMPREAGAGSDY